MKTRKYKVIFFSSYFICALFLSCDGNKRNKENSNYAYTTIEENITATLYRTAGKNWFDFEIDGIKYTLSEIKMDGGSSIYNLYSTDAMSWQEHDDMRNEYNTIFDIRFMFGWNHIEMDVLSYGQGYTSDYDVLNGNMIYDKIER